MPAQPFGRRRKSITEMIFGATFTERPKFAHLIMQVIEKWSVAEAITVQIFCKLIGSQPEVALAMLQAIANQAARRDAIMGAAKKGLKSDDYTLFAAAFCTLNESRKVRHSFAHHIWGHSLRLPKSLLLISPTAYNNYEAEMIVWMAAPFDGNTRKPIPALDVDGTEIMEWTEKSLKDAVQKAERALTVVFDLDTLISTKFSGPIGDSRRKQLSSDPLVAQKIRNLNK